MKNSKIKKVKIKKFDLFETDKDEPKVDEKEITKNDKLIEKLEQDFKRFLKDDIDDYDIDEDDYN